MTSFLSLRDPNPVFVPVELGLEGFLKGTTLDQLPSWLTKEDIDYYAAQFDKTGFTGGLNYYRAMDLYYSRYTY